MNGDYKSSPLGTEISCQMYHVDSSILNNPKGLEEMFKKALKSDGFGIIKDVKHEFEPQGYTIAIILAESHAALSTYPEYGTVSFNLSSCRGENDGRKTLNYLKERLKPKRISLGERRLILDPSFLYREG